MDTGLRRYDKYKVATPCSLLWHVYLRGTFQMPSMIMVGDVNLMNVADPSVPFARLAEEMSAANVVFANLECCLYRPPGAHAECDAAGNIVIRVAAK